MAERIRERPLKRLEVCQVCGGYMRPISPITAAGGGPTSRHWKDETYHRSFGGKVLKKFVCEKCAHVETFQVDDLEHIKEDE